MVNGYTKIKLELTWIGKENRPKLEPRILLEDAGKSYHAPYRMAGNDLFDSRPSFGRVGGYRVIKATFTCNKTTGGNS